MATNKKRWAVRIILQDDGRDVGILIDEMGIKYRGLGTWITILDRMGLMKRLQEFDKPGEIFEIYPPDHIGESEQNQWANTMAEYVKSFGINATAAPEWKE